MQPTVSVASGTSALAWGTPAGRIGDTDVDGGLGAVLPQWQTRDLCGASTRVVSARRDLKVPKRKTIAAMDLVVFLPLLIILGAFMFFASRRQKKAMQATIDLHNSLTIGDRVHTTSGLQGTITGMTDDNVDLEIAPGVITTWMKLAVRDRIEADTESTFDDDYDDDDNGAVEPPSTATEVLDSPTVSDPNRLKND